MVPFGIVTYGVLAHRTIKRPVAAFYTWVQNYNISI